MASSVVTAIEKAGVVGAGGGGFPSHVKAASRADVVLGNGAECEPLLRGDSELMRTHAARVLRGLAIMRDSVGASRAILALKKKNERTREAIERELGEDDGIELMLLSNVYPAGDEFLLVFEATGRVVPEGGIPLDVGVVVNNVTTLAQVSDAVEGRPVTRRFVTVQGKVERPSTFGVPLGTPVGELLEAAGWSRDEAPAIIVGGPMMGHLASGSEEPTTKTVAGLIALPDDHPLVASMSARESQVLRLARAACCQCMACTELCPRALLGHDLRPHRTVRAIQYSDYADDQRDITSAFLCCECGMCELFACPLGIQPRRILADLKAELAKRGVANPHTRSDLSPDDVREYRQIPSGRLTQRLGLSEYDGPAPISDTDIRPALVTLKMKQHAGAAAVPAVKTGHEVLEGDVIAEPPEGELGARVHASVSGRVESVTEAEIVLAAAVA